MLKERRLPAPRVPNPFGAWDALVSALTAPGVRLPIDEIENVDALLPTMPLAPAAASLSHGRALAQHTQEAFRQQLMPTALYMAAGDAGWIWSASHEGALTKLWDRPAVVQ